MWAECWADLIVSDRASGWLPGRPFRGSGLSCGRWHHQQLLWGLAADACSEGASSDFCTPPPHPHPLSLGRAREGWCPAFCLVFVVFISLASLHEGKFSLGYLILAFSHGNTQGHNPTRRKTAQSLSSSWLVMNKRDGWKSD